MTTATVKTDAETKLETLLAAEAEIRPEAETWNGTRQKLEARSRELAGELATVAEQLRDGRMAELRGEKVGLAALATRERDLLAEQAETAERLSIASAEWQRANGVLAAAVEARSWAAVAVQREAAVAEAAELDSEINEALAVITDLLNRRHAVEPSAPFRWDGIPNAFAPRAIQLP
jgi:hypothetical protein